MFVLLLSLLVLNRIWWFCCVALLWGWLCSFPICVQGRVWPCRTNFKVVDLRHTAGPLNQKSNTKASFRLAIQGFSKKTAIRAQTVVLCSQQTTGMYTNHRIDRDGHWQQFGTQRILISAPQWASWSCNAPTGFYRVG